MSGFNFIFGQYLYRVCNKILPPTPGAKHTHTHTKTSQPKIEFRDKNLINLLFIETSSYAWILISNRPLNLHIKYCLYYATSKLFTS